MGGAVSAQSKREVEETIKKVLTVFTLEYAKWINVYTVQKFKLEETATTYPLKLDQRPSNWNRKETFKSGWLTKEGGVRKNMKRRWFVCKPDYSVDYYEKEEDVAAGKKPKGTMYLKGYYIYRNVNSEAMKRIENVAKKMGVNLDDIPKPKEYPEFTFELHHWRRRCYFITADNQQDFDDWIRMFNECSWENKGLKNQDWVHVNAFNRSVQETRYQLGRWGWWSYGGTEEQVLSDLIADQVEWAVMGALWCKLSGPYIIRNQIYKKAQGAIDTAVGAAVKPAWAAMEKAAEAIRPKLEPMLKEIGAKLGETEVTIKKAIKDATLPTINPSLDENVKPHVSKVHALLKDPMERAYDGALGTWTTMSADFQKEGLKTDKDGFEANQWPINRVTWYQYNNKEKLDECYDPLWLLSNIFPQIWPSSVIYEGKRAIDAGIDSACYSYYKRIHNKFEKGKFEWDKDEPKVREKITHQLKHDAEIWRGDWYLKGLKLILMPPLNKIIKPLVSAALTPIDAMVPEPMKMLINVHSLFDDIVDEMVDAILLPLLGFNIQKVSLKEYKKKKSDKDKIEGGAQSNEQVPVQAPVQAPVPVQEQAPVPVHTPEPVPVQAPEPVHAPEPVPQAPEPVPVQEPVQVSEPVHEQAPAQATEQPTEQAPVPVTE